MCRNWSANTFQPGMDGELVKSLLVKHLQETTVCMHLAGLIKVTLSYSVPGGSDESEFTRNTCHESCLAYHNWTSLSCWWPDGWPLISDGRIGCPPRQGSQTARSLRRPPCGPERSSRTYRCSNYFASASEAASRGDSRTPTGFSANTWGKENE